MPAAVQEKQTVHSVYVTERTWKRWQRLARRLGYRTVSEAIRAAMEGLENAPAEP